MRQSTNKSGGAGRVRKAARTRKQRAGVTKHLASEFKHHEKKETWVTSCRFVISAINSPNCKSTPSLVSTQIWYLELCVCYLHHLYTLWESLSVSSYHLVSVAGVSLPQPNLSVSTLVSDIVFPRMPFGPWSKHDGLVILRTETSQNHLCNRAQHAVLSLLQTVRV